MKLIALVAVFAVLTACGSDNNGPTDKFSGNWVGNAYVQSDDTLHFTIAATQTGSSTTGSGTISNGGESDALSFTGTSTPPTVNLTFTINNEVLTYVGTYINADSISGTISEGGDSAPMFLGKH